MHSLIIVAHPSSVGFSHKIAERYKQTREKLGNTCEIHDLYKDWKQDFLSFESPSELRNGSDLTKEIQTAIQKADEVIFCFPLWWYEAPAVLRNFIDINFSSHFAFKFHSSGMVQGLLQPRKAKIFLTSGGPAWVYKLKIMPCANAFRKTISQCGLKIQSLCIFGTNHKRTPEEHEVWLKKVEKEAKD